MPDRQGRCTNFGNCSKADSKEIISVPIGVDFVCPEPNCQTPLVPVAGGKGGLDQKRRFQIIIGMIVIILSGLGIYYYLLGKSSPSAEGKFLSQVRTVLETCDRNQDGISSDKIKALKTLADNLNLSDRADELIRIGKQNYLLEKRNALGVNVTPKELQPLCELAKKLSVDGVDGCFNDNKTEYAESELNAANQPLSAKEPVITPQVQNTISMESKQNFQQGLQFAARRDFNNAIKEFTAAIQKDPSYAIAYSNRGAAYMQQKKFNIAEDDMKKASELSPNDPIVNYNLMSLYSLQKGKFDRALNYLDLALTNGFNDYDALRKDPDLENLRKHPEWRKILEKHKIFLGTK